MQEKAARRPATALRSQKGRQLRGIGGGEGGGGLGDCSVVDLEECSSMPMLLQYNLEGISFLI